MTAAPIPIRSVFGYEEIFRSFRQWLIRRKSSEWAQALGTVEGYEFLSASKNGWLVVYYSYTFGGQSFSGEWRSWLLFSFSSIEAEAEKITARFPVGVRIEIRVDPNNPSRSIACL
jgi:hypothetical protein